MTMSTNAFNERLSFALPAHVSQKLGLVVTENRKGRREFKKLHQKVRKAKNLELKLRLASGKLITADVGTNSVYLYAADGSISEEQSEISRKDFLNLLTELIPSGSVLVIEEAHLRPRNSRSKAQAFEYSDLIAFFEKAAEKDILVYVFPQMSTPKARGFMSGNNSKISDYNDCQAICQMVLNQFDLCSLREFAPISEQQFLQANSARTQDLDLLNDDVNKLRNVAYDKADVNSPFHQAVQQMRQHLFENLNDTQLAMLKLEPTKRGVLGAPRGSSYNKVAFLLITLIRPDGTLRLSADTGKSPLWKYVKANLMGCTCYHMSAGVTASNLKYHLHRHTSFRVPRTLISLTKEQQAYKPWTPEEQLGLTAARAEFWVNVRDIWRVMREFVLEQHHRSVVVSMLDRIVPTNEGPELLAA